METNFTALPTICSCGSAEFTARAYIPFGLEVATGTATWRLGTAESLECVVEASCNSCGASAYSNLQCAETNQNPAGPVAETSARFALEHTIGITRLLLRDLLPIFASFSMTRSWYARQQAWKVERS